MLLVCGLFAFSCISSGALAQKKEEVYADFSSPESLELVAVGTVRDIPKPDEIILTDGKTYILDNIRVPAHYENLALEYLKRILIGKEVGIFMNPHSKDSRVDQSGHKIGHVMTSGAAWVQANLIAQGLAYAFSQPESNVLIPALYKHEEQARKANAGFWQNPLYAIRNRETIENAIGSFQVFEDVVDDVRTRGDYVSIIFGKEIPSALSLLIKKDTGGGTSVPVANLVKERIRVHGWVENNNGAIMYITHPEQIEILNPAKAPKRLPDCTTGSVEERRSCKSAFQ